MQDSAISWVRVPLKYTLNNQILSDTNQHQVQFWSSFLDIDFLYKFRFMTSIGALDLVPQSDKLSERSVCRVGEGGGVHTLADENAAQDATVSAVSASCCRFFGGCAG